MSEAPRKTGRARSLSRGHDLEDELTSLSPLPSPHTLTSSSNSNNASFSTASDVCKVGVTLPSGARTIVYLPRLCSVDQVKSKVWTSVQELHNLDKGKNRKEKEGRKRNEWCLCFSFLLFTFFSFFFLSDSFVLCLGEKKLIVEFQKLLRADPSVSECIENDRVVELALVSKGPVASHLR